MEIWKPIVGYENYYEVSNMGRVKSLPREIVKSDGVTQHRKEYIKKPSLDSDGYLTVGMCVGGSNVKRTVHTLVAEAFVDGWFEGAEVNHIDFNRANNRSCNLEWVSHGRNIEHTINAGRHVSQLSDRTGKNNPNYGNTTLRDRYASDPEYAVLKQSRHGSSNGRARAVRMTNPSMEVVEFSFIRECARYMIASGMCNHKSEDFVASKISSAARNKTHFCKMTFEFV